MCACTRGCRDCLLLFTRGLQRAGYESPVETRNIDIVFTLFYNIIGITHADTTDELLITTRPTAARRSLPCAVSAVRFLDARTGRVLAHSLASLFFHTQEHTTCPLPCSPSYVRPHVARALGRADNPRSFPRRATHQPKLHPAADEGEECSVSGLGSRLTD